MKIWQWTALINNRINFGVALAEVIRRTTTRVTRLTLTSLTTAATNRQYDEVYVNPTKNVMIEKPRLSLTKE